MTTFAIERSARRAGHLWSALKVPAAAPALSAAACFGLLCVAVLTRASSLLEPDDLAYQASITALLHGHLWLTNAQYAALGRQLSGAGNGGFPGIVQWVHRPDGTWISEKNPGYPFFAVPFAWLGIRSVAPLFYGAIGAVGLYLGGRRWLGPWGGTTAVFLFVSSGAAMVFAWRATMPTFTDAALVAAGCGLLLWTVLASEHGARHRMLAGLAAFFALDAATFIRYTDIVALGCAAAAVCLLWLFARHVLPRRAIGVWLVSQVAFAAFIAWIDTVLYGHPWSTGYRAGEITFSTAAIGGNVRTMSGNLLVTMPVLVLAATACVLIVVRMLRARRDPERRGGARTDLRVGAGLAAVWIGIFGLYAAYTWTDRMSGLGGTAWGNVHLVRFYLPAIGPVALIGAWLVVRLPKVLAAIALAGVLALGVVSADAMAATGAVGGFGPFGRAGCGGGVPGGLPPGLYGAPSVASPGVPGAPGEPGAPSSGASGIPWSPGGQGGFAPLPGRPFGRPGGAPPAGWGAGPSWRYPVPGTGCGSRGKVPVGAHGLPGLPSHGG